jgi:hypothetical protein
MHIVGKGPALQTMHGDNLSTTEYDVLADSSFCGPIHPNLSYVKYTSGK